jgi:hypothetical protein
MEIPKRKNEFLPYFLLVVFIFLLILIVSYNGIGTKEHAELMDTDTYMRLVRVEQLAETGDWYDSVIHRSNYPYGDELHWTRPLDVMLLAGAYALTPFQGFEKGLLAWGIIISPLLGIFCLLALYWATLSVMNKNSRRLLWLLFISQSLLLQVFHFSRPDHHSLLMLLFIILLGCLFRMVNQPDRDKYVFLGGFIAAFSLWVSVETIFPIIMVFITLGVLWLIRGEAYARQLLLFSLSIFVFSTIFLFIERPLSALFVVEYDKISIAYLFVFMLAVLATYLLTLIRNATMFSKLLKSTLILMASGLAIWLVFPSFYRGPMAGINKALIPIWLSRVSEIQPLWSLDPYHMTIIIGSIILFLLYFIYLVVTKRFKNHFNLLIPLISGFAIFFPLGVYQIRMDYYLLVIIIMLLAVFLDDIITSISNSKLSNFSKPLLRVVVMLLFILGLPGIGIATSLDNDTKSETIEPDLKTLSSFLNDYQQTNPTAETILTFLDFGPELLYRTDFNLISTPYHRNDQGILYNYQVMAEDSMEQAQKPLAERSVDMLILCPESLEKHFYKTTLDQSTFYERLIAGENPAFLEEIDLPPELDKTFKVYRIIN